MGSTLAKTKALSKRRGPCVATTKAGTLCKRKAEDGSTVCAAHRTPAQLAATPATVLVLSRVLVRPLLRRSLLRGSLKRSRARTLRMS